MSDVQKIIDALGDSFKQFGFDLEATCRKEFDPATCVQKLPDWEAALGIANTIVAASGTTAQRQNAVISKLRESGASTLPIIRSSIGQLLGYTNPDDLVIYETPRAALRTAHTYGVSGASVAISTTPTALSIEVLDGGVVARADFQLALTFASLSSASILVTVTGPDRTANSFALADYGLALQSGALSVNLYGKSPLSSAPGAHTGAAISGEWTLTVATSTGTGTLTAWGLFVEGIGGGVNVNGPGLGGDQFTFGCYADPALVNDPDYDGAVGTFPRIQPAHTQGFLLRSISPNPDDTTTIPDQCIPV